MTPEVKLETAPQFQSFYSEIKSRVQEGPIAFGNKMERLSLSPYENQDRIYANYEVKGVFNGQEGVLSQGFILTPESLTTYSSYFGIELLPNGFVQSHESLDVENNEVNWSTKGDNFKEPQRRRINEAKSKYEKYLMSLYERLKDQPVQSGQE